MVPQPYGNPSYQGQNSGILKNEGVYQNSGIIQNSETDSYRLKPSEYA